MTDKMLSGVASIMGDRPSEEIIRTTVEKYWPGSMTWEEIVAQVRALPDDRFGHEEIAVTMHLAGILGVFGFPEGSEFREEKQVSIGWLNNQRVSKLLITTSYPEAVESILLSQELIEQHWPKEKSNASLYMSYPDDAMSQVLGYWLAMAQGCGLIDEYEFTERDISK